jgi:hypothetical protein
LKFGNEFWLILIREYIIPNFFAVWVTQLVELNGKAQHVFKMNNILYSKKTL